MFRLLDLAQPATVAEAYQTLMNKRSNTVLGGCAFLRMGSKRIGTAVDLSKLGLNYITEQNDYIEIGAMTTLRDVETSSVLNKYFNGVVPRSVSGIIGVQFRNAATLGASVFSRYGFSDLITALLALDTEVELYHGGRMTLQDFLQKPYEKDILTRILLQKNARKAAYQNLRRSASDFPVLNVAVSKLDDQFTVVVGARPMRAQMARQASIELSKQTPYAEQIENAASIAAEELSFGSNIRGTAGYRRAMCKVLVRRGITEVLQCR